MNLIAFRLRNKLTQKNQVGMQSWISNGFVDGDDHNKRQTLANKSPKYRQQMGYSHTSHFFSGASRLKSLITRALF